MSKPGILQAYRRLPDPAATVEVDVGEGVTNSLRKVKGVLTKGEGSTKDCAWGDRPFAPTTDAMFSSVNSILSNRFRAIVSSSDLGSGLDASVGRL